MENAYKEKQLAPYGKLQRTEEGGWCLTAGDEAININPGDIIDIGRYGGRPILARLSADPYKIWPDSWLVSSGFPRPYPGAYASLVHQGEHVPSWE
jgi:hypothetical protein